MISGSIHLKYADPIGPLKEMYRFRGNEVQKRSVSTIKYGGFLAFGMESFTNPKPGQNGNLSVDLKLEESFNYKSKKVNLDQESSYSLSYIRINELTKENDEFKFNSGFQLKPDNDLAASLNCIIETGLLNNALEDAGTGSKVKSASLFNPGKFHGGVGARVKAGILQIELLVPDIKIDLKLNDTSPLDESAEANNGEAETDPFMIETGYRVGINARHNLAPGIDLKTRGRIFAANENFKKMELNFDNELNLTFNKFIKTGIHTRLLYDGINDPTTRIRNLVKFGIYF